MATAKEIIVARLTESHRAGDHQKPVFACPSCIVERGKSTPPTEQEQMTTQVRQVVAVGLVLIEEVYNMKPTKASKKLMPFAEQLDDEIKILEEKLT